MSFWDKLFKRNLNKSQAPTEISVTPKQVVQITPAVSNAAGDTIMNEQKKQYQFQFTLIEEALQQRILDYVRPVTSDLDILNLQVAYGIKEAENGLFVVRRNSTQRRDNENDKTYHTTGFVVMTEEQIFDASYTSESHNDSGDLIYDIPDKYEEILKQAFDFWRNWPAHKEFERVCAAENPGFIMSKRNYEICQPLRKELKKYQEQQKKLKESQKQHMDITCEEEAKQLFFACDTDCYRKIKEDYDEETIKVFEQYADREKKRAWIIEECSQILQNIIDGDREKIYDKLSKVDGRCSYWLGTEAEALVPLYTEAVKVLCESEEKRFIVCIHSFLSNLKNCDNPACAEELLQITENYYKENYPEEYAKNDISAHPWKFKQICCTLRGRMKELAVSENPMQFCFVLTNQEDLRSIVLWYRNKYNDDVAVKESVAELNCAYGVENQELFLAALSDTCVQTTHQHWDRLSFVGILRSGAQVLEVRCRRETTEGDFVIDYYDGPVKENWNLVCAAMEYYRNQPARKAFFEAYKQEKGEEISVLVKASHKGLLSKFKRHYEKEYKLASGNPLKKTLIKLIDLCEERGASYGYKNTKFGKPTTVEEMESWEQEQGIELPEDYKHFLSFADGGQFFGDSECIFGLKGLKVEDEFLEPDYMHLGNMIGDGTMICLSKTDSKVYICDHGEYEDKGTFKDFLEYFVDFLSGF